MMTRKKSRRERQRHSTPQHSPMRRPCSGLSLPNLRTHLSKTSLRSLRRAHSRMHTPSFGNSLAKEYHAELQLLEKAIYKAAGHEFNISSPKQLGDVLFDELALTPQGTGQRQKKTATGQRSTRESELEKIRDLHPIVGQILEYRELKKLLSTYIDNLPPLLDAKHRLHTEFLQTGTTTGRMASQNPNLQNIPLHSERGRAIRRRAKVINFGILYGMGVNALRAQLSSTTAEAHQFLDDYFHTFTTLAEYLEKTKGFARKHGYTETLFGRRRQFPEMKSPLPYVRAQAERMAINAPLQGTQADIIKLAMVKIDDDLCAQGVREDAHLLLQVHDELVYEIKT